MDKQNYNPLTCILFDLVSLYNTFLCDSEMFLEMFLDKYINILLLIISLGADINCIDNNGNLILGKLVYSLPDKQSINKFIKLGFNINHKNNDNKTELMKSIEQNLNLDYIQFLIDIGCDTSNLNKEYTLKLKKILQKDN